MVKYMLRFSINIAFLTLLIAPIGFCFLVLTKYVVNDIVIKEDTVVKHKNHYREYEEEHSISKLRIVK